MIEIGDVGDARHASRPIVAYVPANAPSAPLPVLYVVDGDAAFREFGIGAAIDELVAQRSIVPWAVVAIPSRDRNRELARGADAFIDFVADVVRPAVAARIRIRTERDSAAFLGFSYGGLTAVRAALHRPDAFGRVIAMSPSLWFRARASLDAFERDDGRLPTRMWIDIGSTEGRWQDRVPYMVRDARDLRDAAIARGMRFGRNLGYDEAIGERHEMPAVGRRIRTALAFALSERDLADANPSEVHIVRFAPNSEHRCAFAVQARYGGPFRLTWPASNADVRTRSGSAVRADVVTPSTALRACVHGTHGSLD
jgi:predicted alpha/beta superfamily hydrolase